MALLGRLFRRKCRAIVIARSSSSCKNFNLAHYSQSFINTEEVTIPNLKYLLTFVPHTVLLIKFWKDASVTDLDRESECEYVISSKPRSLMAVTS